MNRRKLLTAMLIRSLRKRLKRKPREVYIRPIFGNRIVSGESILVRELQSDSHYHNRYFRMNYESFQELLDAITPAIQGNRNHAVPVSPLEKLAVTLRYLASGNSQISLGMSYRLSPSMVSRILRQTMEALCQYLSPQYLPVPTTESWQHSESKFASKWNFPNCCGAIDGKHVRVRAPDCSGSQNFNYKNYFFVVLMAIVGSDYQFLAVDIGASGSMSDGGVLLRSPIGKALQDETLNLPDAKYVGNELLPHVIVGDDAFPLKKNLIKPFPGRLLTIEERVCNYRISRARMVVENAFGILSGKWRVYHTAIHGNKDLINLVIKTTVLLHNFLIARKDTSGITGDSVDKAVIVPGTWRNVEVQLDGINKQGSNNYSTNAAEIRKKFSNYFNGIGSVDWQMAMI